MTAYAIEVTDLAVEEVSRAGKFCPSRTDFPLKFHISPTLSMRKS